MTTFVVREGDILYLSHNYGFDHASLLPSMFCMIAYSLGLTKKKLKLPKPDTTWWTSEIEEAATRCLGVVTQYVKSNHLLRLN